MGDKLIKQKEVTAWIDSARDLGLIGCVAYDYLQKRLESVSEEKKSQANCPTCKRCSDNEGFYDDGRTRCPIEEHYALPKDGYCHLYEPIKGKADMYSEGVE